MDDADEWGLWQGRDTRLMQTWPREITERMLGAARPALDFITYGDEETLNAIRDLHNAQVRAQQGE